MIPKGTPIEKDNAADFIPHLISIKLLLSISFISIAKDSVKKINIDSKKSLFSRLKCLIVDNFAFYKQRILNILTIINLFFLQFN